MGIPIIRGFKATDPGLVKLFNKAKLQRTLTGEISETLISEIDAYFGSCDECMHQVEREMYGKTLTICTLVGAKQHRILDLIVKIAKEGRKEFIRGIGFCSGFTRK